MLDTLLLGPSLHFKHFTTLHPTTLHCTYRHFDSSHLHFTDQVVQVSSVFTGLGNWWIGFLCPAGLRDIFLIHNNQADSGVHPASYEPYTGGASTGVKAAGPRSCHLYPSSPRPSVTVAILPLSHTCSPRLITHGDFTLLMHYDMGVQTAAREFVAWRRGHICELCIYYKICTTIPAVSYTASCYFSMCRPRNSWQ
jgi:hypothetical protein